MHRFDQRQGFLVSAILHLTLLMVLIAHPLTPRKPDEIDPSTLERKDLVFLPPAAVLRQLAPKLPPGARPRPIPAPTPPPVQAQPQPQGKDRISVGPPTDLRSKGPMILQPRRRPDQGAQGADDPAGSRRADAAPGRRHARARGPGRPEGRRRARDTGAPGASAPARPPRRTDGPRGRGTPREPRGPRTLDRRRHGQRRPAHAEGRPARPAHGDGAEPGRAVLRPPGGGLHSLDQHVQERGLSELDRAAGRPASASGGTSISSSPSRGTDRCRRCGC